MDLRKIKKLIDLLEESNLAEIEIKEGEESVRLCVLPVLSLKALGLAQSGESRERARAHALWWCRHRRCPRSWKRLP